MADKKIRVKLVHSAIGRNKNQEKIVKGLGLRKLNSERELLDTQAIRGMVAKIPHLVQIVEENVVAKKSTKPKASKTESKTETKVEVKSDEA